jgi:PAS domain S-box-containing protein
MKKQLKDKHEILKNIVNNIPYYIFWKNKDLEFEGANKLVVEATGFSSEEELIGKTDFDCPWEESEALFFRKIDQEVMDSGKPILNIEEPQLQADGTEKTLLTSKVPLYDDEGNVSGILGIFTDITSRKNLELEREKHIQELQSIQSKLIQSAKMKSLGEMAGGIAHEINNPLAIIKSSAARLRRVSKRGELTHEEILEGCLRIEETVDRCQNIINALKGFSRDGSKESHEAINLSSVLSTIFNLSSEKVKEKGIDFINPPTDELIFCQRISSEQILLNLINNSMDALVYTENPFIKLKIKSDNDFVTVDIIDNGIGIPKSLQQKVFEPFYTTKELNKGTGLGLSVSRGMAEQNGGTLEYSRIDDLSIFSLKIKKAQI